jgi:hypothetical protein
MSELPARRAARLRPHARRAAFFRRAASRATSESNKEDPIATPDAAGQGRRLRSISSMETAP